MLALGLKDRSVPKIVRTIATQGEGIEELYKKTLGLSMVQEGDSRTIRKKRLVEWMLKDIISAKISRDVQLKVRPKEFASFVEKIYLRKIDPYSVADQILSRLK